MEQTSLALTDPRDAFLAQLPYNLRGYQREFLEVTNEKLGALAPGQPGKFVIQQPTGTGKTLQFMSLLGYLDLPTMLVLAHRDELITQAYRKARELYPHLKVQIEKAEDRVDSDCHIVIASRDSIGRKGQASRLTRFDPEKFSIIIVDEAHHAMAPTYLRLFAYFKPKLLLGVTATMMRGDGKPLANVFDEVIFYRTIQRMIEEGEADLAQGPYLSRFIGKRISTPADLRNLHVRAGEFKTEELAAAVNIDGRHSVIISALEQHASDRECILIFMPDRLTVETLTQQLKDRGHDAELVLGNTPKEDRKKRLEDFYGGRLRIMVSCEVMTEGVDIPRIDCLGMGRPTLSPSLYTQMLGRGGRPYPGKKNCLVLDFADVCGKYRPMSIGEAFGVRDLDFNGEDVYDKSKVVQQAMELGVATDGADSIEDLERRFDTLNQVVKGTITITTEAEMIDVLDASQLAEEVVDEAKFPWVKISDRHYVLPMMDGSVIELEMDALGVWRCESRGIHYRKETNTAEPPFRWADAKVKNLSPDCWRAKRIGARWQREPATAKQIAALRNRFRIMAIPPNFTKGAACDLMDKLIMLRKRNGNGARA